MQKPPGSAGGKMVGIITATDILKSGERVEMAVLKKLAEFYPAYLKSGRAG